MKLGSMADLTADITPEKRERIDAIKAEMADAEREHEPPCSMSWAADGASADGPV